MRFQLTAPAPVDRAPQVQPGDVYKSKGGNNSVYWLVVSVSGRRAHALGLDREGEIVSTTSYGVHTFEGRELLGRCASIAEFQADIEWLTPP